MTNPEKEPERALGALFDRTATPVGDAERALRRAAEIGNAARPLPKARFVWVPALAAAAAVAYLAVPHRDVEPVRVLASATSPQSPAASDTGTVPQAPTPAASAVALAAEEPEDPLATVLAGDPMDLEPLDLGPLMGGSGHDVGPAGTGRTHSHEERQIQRSPQ